MPFQARHCIEHGIIAMFGLTEEEFGGRNVNVVDQGHHETLLPASLAVSVINGLEAVVTELPQLCLPPRDDQWGWEALLRPFFPDGTLVSLNLIQQVCAGELRMHIWRRSNHPRLSAYLDSQKQGRFRHDGSIRARSEASRLMHGYPKVDGYTDITSPTQALDRMVEIMTRVADSDAGAA